MRPILQCGNHQTPVRRRNMLRLDTRLTTGTKLRGQCTKAFTDLCVSLRRIYATTQVEMGPCGNPKKDVRCKCCASCCATVYLKFTCPKLNDPEKGESSIIQGPHRVRSNFCAAADPARIDRKQWPGSPRMSSRLLCFVVLPDAPIRRYYSRGVPACVLPTRSRPTVEGSRDQTSRPDLRLILPPIGCCETMRTKTSRSSSQRDLFWHGASEQQSSFSRSQAHFHDRTTIATTRTSLSLGPSQTRS